MTARASAATILERVLTGGAYANVTIERTAAPEDGAVVRSLVYGTLRRIGEARAAVAAASDRPTRRIQGTVHAVLLVGSHELLHGQTPGPVVVSAWVDAARELGLGRAAGFINAVLRRVAAADPPELGLADATGFPEWLVGDLGPEAPAFIEASNAPARVGHRLPPGTVEPEGSTTIGGIGAAVLADRPIAGLPIQDPASVAVVEALGIEPGMNVLDLAAAPGGKTAHAVDLVGPHGRVVAVDVHERRVGTAARRVPGAHWVLADGRRPPFAAGTFDRILLDAPCSGLGTLRRRPEIRLRVTEQEVERLAGVQTALLDAATTLLAPGGRLVYSVCTVTSAETTAVVAGRGMTAPPGLPGRAAGDGWLLAPHLGETDGMFIAVASV